MCVLVLALPELAASTCACTLGVVVGWRWAISLLLLVVLDQQDLPCGSDEEKEDADDGDSEDCGVEGADITIVAGTGSRVIAESSAKGRVDCAFARIGAMSSIVCNDSEAADEAQVEEDCKVGEEADAAEEESEDDAKDGVEDGCAAHSFNHLLPCWNVDILVGENREKVGVDSEDDGCTGELEESQTCRA